MAVQSPDYCIWMHPASAMNLIQRVGASDGFSRATGPGFGYSTTFSRATGSGFGYSIDLQSCDRLRFWVQHNVQSCDRPRKKEKAGALAPARFPNA
jgi:hypothetical protein